MARHTSKRASCHRMRGEVPHPIVLDEEIHRWARQLDAGDIEDLAFSYSHSYHLVERNDLERKRDWSRGKYHDFAVISQGGYAKMSRAFDHYEIVRVWERLSPSYVRVHHLTYGGLRGWPHQFHDAMQRFRRGGAGSRTAAERVSGGGRTPTATNPQVRAKRRPTPRPPATASSAPPASALTSTHEQST